MLWLRRSALSISTNLPIWPLMREREKLLCVRHQKKDTDSVGLGWDRDSAVLKFLGGTVAGAQTTLRSRALGNQATDELWEWLELLVFCPNPTGYSSPVHSAVFHSSVSPNKKSAFHTLLFATHLQLKVWECTVAQVKRDELMLREMAKDSLTLCKPIHKIT